MFRLLLVSCSAAGLYALSPLMRIALIEFFVWLTAILAWPLVPIILQRVHGYNGIPKGYCQKCGYNLTGNVSGKCPECGLTVLPAVAEKHPI